MICPLRPFYVNWSNLGGYSIAFWPQINLILNGFLVKNAHSQDGLSARCTDRNEIVANLVDPTWNNIWFCIITDVFV